jgi:hypothetical protein
MYESILNSHGRCGAKGRQEREIFVSKTVWLRKRVQVNHSSDLGATDQRNTQRRLDFHDFHALREPSSVLSCDVYDLEPRP